MPQYKADPFHNGNVENEYKKIALQKGEIGIDDVTDLEPKPVEQKENTPEPKQEKETKENTDPQGGRPKFTKDSEPRKQRRVLPKTTPKASVMIWSQEAQKKISAILNPGLLSHYGKKNLRELSKAQLKELEEIKFRVLCNLSPYEKITEEKILKVLDENPTVNEVQRSTKASIFTDFVDQSGREPSIDELRHINNLSYSLNFLDEK